MTVMTPDQLTKQVLAAYAGTPDPRLRQLLTSLIGHLHAFAVETRLTRQEWLAGVDFLTAAGQKCDDDGRSSSCSPTFSASRPWST